MADPITIVSLQVENVKRVRAVHLEPTPLGLTILGGRNRQGKTSLLDAICFGLAGEKYRPTNLQREGSAAPAGIDIVLSNGIKVTRAGKNASLKVTDPTGAKAGQELLSSLIEVLALDLPKFLKMGAKEKGSVVLRILGIGDQLETLKREEDVACATRLTAGQIADQKTKFAAELVEHHDVPEDVVSASALVAEVQALADRNAARAQARTQAVMAKGALAAKLAAVAAEQRAIDSLLAQVVEARARHNHADAEARKLMADATVVPIAVEADESPADIEASLAVLEDTNAKVRANLDKRKALEDAEVHERIHGERDAAVQAIRAQRDQLLASTPMPLERLGITDGELTYDGKAWDCMSGVEQIRAGVAIVRCLKPACGFVLLDGLEQFDLTELAALGAWLKAQKLQAIATRVSTGDECSVIIEDGTVLSAVAVVAQVETDLHREDATDPEIAAAPQTVDEMMAGHVAVPAVLTPAGDADADW